MGNECGSRPADVAAPAIDGDPVFVESTTAAVVEDLKTWWSERHAQVTAELDSHDP